MLLAQALREKRSNIDKFPNFEGKVKNTHAKFMLDQLLIPEEAW